MKSDRKIILVTRKSRIEELVSRFNTIAQAKFYVEHLGADFSDYEKEHENYLSAKNEIRQLLVDFGVHQLLDRSYLSNYIFGPWDIVITLGQDGLVANTLKYLDGQPLIGVNPDPFRYDGILLPFLVSDLRFVLKDVFRDKHNVQSVTIAQVTLNDGQKLYAVNDFFIGMKTHVSSRYEIRLGDQSEFQSSSGVIISTGLGSTGWYKSCVTGAMGIIGKLASGKIRIRDEKSFAPDSNYLRFFVREPFPSKTSGTQLVFGTISSKDPLAIISHNPENGVIFSDGLETDFLNFNSGMKAIVSLADKRGNLVI